MTHRGRLNWIPALQGYQLICEGCGTVILPAVEGLVVEVEGECVPDPVLNVRVAEEISVDDHFGGS